MWSHRLCDRAISAMDCTGSIAVVEVVPIVATTASGRNPDVTSWLMAAANAAGSIARSGPVATACTPRRPSPSAWTAFSTDEWASREV